MCISVSASFQRENTVGRNSSIQLALCSVPRKAVSSSRILDTFPVEVRRFRVPMIRGVRISPIYFRATGFCCKRIPFIPGSVVQGRVGIQAVIHIIDYSRDPFTSSRVSTSKAPLVVCAFIASALARIMPVERRIIKKTRLSNFPG